jgi:hypothetical protein
MNMYRQNSNCGPCRIVHIADIGIPNGLAREGTRGFTAHDPKFMKPESPIMS